MKYPRWSASIFVVLGIIFVLKVVAPLILTPFLNSQLENQKFIRAHIHWATLSIFRPGIVLRGLVVETKPASASQTAPLIYIPKSQISLSWPDLLHLRFFLLISVISPEIHVKPQEIAALKAIYRQPTEKKWNVKIRSVHLSNGFFEIYTPVPDSSPAFHMTISKFNFNLDRSDLEHKERYLLSNQIYFSEGGQISLEGSIQPKSENLSHIKVVVDRFQMRQLNALFKKIANFDLRSGTLDAFTEVNIENKKFKGYLKPMIRDVDVVDWSKEKNKSTIYLLWKSLVEFSAHILENDKTDKVAGVIPFEGDMKEMNTENWVAVGSILKNAFLKAIQPGFEPKRL